jgi:3-oxoacyl-[acyl-carrier-protein] synthase III
MVLESWGVMKDTACIGGIGETAYTRGAGSGLSLLGLQLQAATRAVENAGLTNKQIDGLMPFPGLGTAEEFAANLGIESLRFAATCTSSARNRSNSAPSRWRCASTPRSTHGQ